MKHTLIVLVLSVMVIAGCANTQDTKLRTDPRSYSEAMDMIAGEVGQIDKHLIGGQYGLASNEAELVVKYAMHLSRYEPPRMTNRYDDYIEYDAQVDDLMRSSDRLLFMLQQRRREDARDQLAEVAKRFNRLSLNYGPTYQIGVLERSPNEFRFTESYSSDLPGEMSGNR